MTLRDRWCGEWALCPEWSEGPGHVWRGAPRLGQDNEDILEELGYSSADIEKLYAEGVIVRD